MLEPWASLVREALCPQQGLAKPRVRDKDQPMTPSQQPSLASRAAHSLGTAHSPHWHRFALESQGWQLEQKWVLVVLAPMKHALGKGLANTYCPDSNTGPRTLISKLQMAVQAHDRQKVQRGGSAASEGLSGYRVELRAPHLPQALSPVSLFPSLLSSPFLKSASQLLPDQDQMLEHYFVVYYKHKSL